MEISDDTKQGSSKNVSINLTLLTTIDDNNMSSKDRNSTHIITVVKTDTILIDVDDTTATINLDVTVAIEMKPLKQVDKMSHPLFQLEEIKTDLKNLMEEGPPTTRHSFVLLRTVQKET